MNIPQGQATEKRAIVAVMPVLPDSANLAERLSSLQAEAAAALSYANERLRDIQNGEGDDQESAKEVNRALVYADEQVRALQSLAEEAHAALAAVASYAKEVTEQRDKVVQAYKRAFEHGIMHAYECDACMEDAAVENLAQRMLESSPDMVEEEEQETLAERIFAAHDLYEEMVGEEIAGVRPDAYDRTDILNLVEDAGGIDVDEVYSIPASVIAEDQKLIQELSPQGQAGGEEEDDESDSGDELDFDEEFDDLGEDLDEENS